ncbi:hypothetical protein [Clostridium niameyense]|uniref:hypothetical protein n=1 Tax=Clostridium niameyense TaxID=1622073 RepID=UPI00067F4567
MCPYLYYLLYNNNYMMRGYRQTPIGPPPSWSPMNSPGSSGPPTSPPPNITPSKSENELGVKAVDPGSIRFCRYKFTYIWPSRGRPFWAWIVFIGRRSISGWRWTGWRWVYFGMDLRQIDSFTCF